MGAVDAGGGAVTGADAGGETSTAVAAPGVEAAGGVARVRRSISAPPRPSTATTATSTATRATGLREGGGDGIPCELAQGVPAASPGVTASCAVGGYGAAAIGVGAGTATPCPLAAHASSAAVNSAPVWKRAPGSRAIALSTMLQNPGSTSPTSERMGGGVDSAIWKSKSVAETPLNGSRPVTDS